MLYYCTYQVPMSLEICTRIDHKLARFANDINIVENYICRAQMCDVGLKGYSDNSLVTF